VSELVEAALVAEVDVEERDVRPQLAGEPDRLGARRRHGHHPHPLALKQRAGGPQEVGAVVDDEQAQGHTGFTVACRHQPAHCS
jgi:hypothetical protein